MASASQDRRRARYGMAASLFPLLPSVVLTAIAVFILYRFPPEIYRFYPACPIHENLHLECPGCGATRAISALLHGRLAQAVRLNALVILLVLPLTAIYAAISVRRALKSEPFRWPAIPPPATAAALAIAAVFTLFRNL